MLWRLLWEFYSFVYATTTKIPNQQGKQRFLSLSFSLSIPRPLFKVLFLFQQIDFLFTKRAYAINIHPPKCVAKQKDEQISVAHTLSIFQADKHVCLFIKLGNQGSLQERERDII